MFTELSVQSRIEHPDALCGQKSCDAIHDKLRRKIDNLNEFILGIDNSLKRLNRKDSKLSKGDIQSQLTKICDKIAFSLET